MSVVVDFPAPGVTRLAMDRPGKLNAIDLSMVRALRREVDAVSGGTIVLCSSGRRAFSTGADLDVPDSERARTSDALYELYLAMLSSPALIVAAADGHAIGGGAQLLLASDVRFGGRDLTIRFAGAGHGLVVGMWGLPSVVGRSRALELCVAMRPIGAAEAAEIGLLAAVESDPVSAAVAFAAAAATMDPSVLVDLKAHALTDGVADALRRERERNARWDGSVRR